MASVAYLHEQLSSVELSTPNLTKLNSEIVGISPTQPLNVKPSSSKVDLAVRTTSLSSATSQPSLTTYNTYETALEFDEENNNCRSSRPSSTSNEVDNNTLSGLELETTPLNSTFYAPTIPLRRRSSSYYDEPTPKVENHHEFVPVQSNKTQKLMEDKDLGATPKIIQKLDFNYGADQLNPTQRKSSDISFNYNPTGSSENLVQEAQRVIVQHVYTSPIQFREKSPIINEFPKISQNQLRIEDSENEFSFTSEADETAYSQELRNIEEEKKIRHNTANLLGSYKSSTPAVPSPEDKNLESLFITAIHSFDSNTLKLEEDAAICLSFNKNDVAYIHSLDASGWGEVTLLNSLKRGWIPVNFFTEMMKEEGKHSITNKTPLKKLLISCARFLNNQPDNPDNGDANFSLKQINDIRDGVRDLLEKTDCLSRSAEVIKQKPILRKIRKMLLADWYSLMIKADSYKHSRSPKHLNTLQSMVFQVLKKSLGFFDTWNVESQALKKELERKKLDKLKRDRTDNAHIPNLKAAPFAKERLNEIHNLLFSYIGLLLGRLDMVEHNPSGCQLLEKITHQMILLLRELLFISKSCVLILNEKNTKADAKNDDNLDTLLSLVSELVSTVKNFVTKTIQEDYTIRSLKVKDGLYYYTPEGDDLIGIISRMTRSITGAVETCQHYLVLIGDFRLNTSKTYPDFKAVLITPETFIKTCSIGLLKTLDGKDNILKNVGRESIKRQSRFSMVRSGVADERGLTPSGTSLLQEFLPDSKSFIRSSVFEPFMIDSNKEYTIDRDIKDEIIYDSKNKLVGASFRGLVALLTDELQQPDQFFICTFFLTFKQYSNGVELIEKLIERFNLTNKFDKYDDYDVTGEYSSYESRLKNRRRLICRMLKIWLESYWDYSGDYNLLPTLINFFNEGVSEYLPIEAKKLMELCSKLTVMTPGRVQNKSSTGINKGTIINRQNSHSSQISQSLYSKNNIQLVKRHFSGRKHSSTLSHSSSQYSISSLNKDLDDDDYIFEEYELAKINSSSHRNSVLLPLPSISIHNNSLLSKSLLQDIESSVMVFRRSLGTTQWVHDDDIHYQPIDLSKILPRWFEICQLQLNTVVTIDLNLVEINAFELAKQLTIIESKIFLSVKPDELLNGNFSQKKSKLNLSPNIQYSLLFTNLLSEYILQSILDPIFTHKQRVVHIKDWLNIALSCYYLKNYNSLAAIVISLQNHILSRLDILWNDLPMKYQNLFEDLKKIIHPSNNYKGYRYKIAKILEENDQKSNTPIVPYINLFLQDLTFIHDGNKDFRHSGSFLKARIVNFDKFTRITKIISDVEFLQVGYDQGIVPKVSKRNSIFSFSSTSSTTELSPILPLQELILLELWKVHQLNLRDVDRYWTLSKAIKE